jgi:aprataxin
MSSKRKDSPSSSPSTSKKSHASNLLFGRRSGLGAYIIAPEKYGAQRVISYNDAFVTIHDLYPKSSVHCLLLPRNEKYQLMHPFDAFEDAEFLATCRIEAAKLKSIVAKELQRKYGQFSKLDEPREAVLNGDVELPDDEPLPVGRDWEKEVIVGSTYTRNRSPTLHILCIEIHLRFQLNKR